LTLFHARTLLSDSEESLWLMSQVCSNHSFATGFFDSWLALKLKLRPPPFSIESWENSLFQPRNWALSLSCF